MFGHGGQELFQKPPLVIAKRWQQWRYKKSFSLNMKDSKSSLLLYLPYKYFFSFMIVITILSTVKEFIQNKISFDTIDNRDFT
jgi:hypothetical protein